MKKIYLYLILIAVLGMTSCSDFLNLRPIGSIDQDALLDYDGIQKVLTSMYASLYQTDFSNSITNYTYGDVMGGTANKGSASNDQPAFTDLETYTIVADNAYLNGKWSSCYSGVFKANDVIFMANKIKDELSIISGESKDFYTETLAQAHFIRGFWHFETIKHFSAAVPYVGTEEYAASVNPMISNVNESGNYIYIWDKVEEDLQYAYDNLPDTWSRERGRVNKWAAAALLAKVKMFHSSPYNGKNHTVNKWAEVKSLLETIMASGKDNNGTGFRLADTYEELWVASTSDWTGESVFDVQYFISGTQITTNTHAGNQAIAMSGALGLNGWGFFQPAYEMVNSHIVDANGLPLLDRSYQNVPPLSVFDGTLVNTDLTVYTDPRLDLTTGRFGTPYWDYAIPARIDGWVREPGNGGPYLNKKYMPKKSDRGTLSVSTAAGSTAKNYHVIRYADVLLWYAEALIETGDWVGAREYVNQVRARAANWYLEAADPADMSPTTSEYVLDDKVNGKTGVNAAGNYRIGLWPESQFATKESALAALRFERKIEFGLEGHRWYDLARWGIIGSELSSFIQYEKQYLSKYQMSTYLNDWTCLPIPFAQITMLQGMLVQNEVWK